MLKALASALQDALLAADFPKTCTHLKGLGSIPKAVQTIQDSISEYQYVFKSDVKGYYESIDHDILQNQIKAKFPEDQSLHVIIEKFLKHDEEFGGLYSTMEKGITKSCPLSPVLGAIYLEPLDRAMAQHPVKYIRYMDDWIVLAKTRWQLKKAIKKCNQILNELKLGKAPDKTFIGKIEKGFDFCGFRFNTEGVIDLASKTFDRVHAKVSRLYEQSQKTPKSFEPVKRYIKRVEGWVKGVVAYPGKEKNKKRSFTWRRKISISGCGSSQCYACYAPA